MSAAQAASPPPVTRGNRGRPTLAQAQDIDRRIVAAAHRAFFEQRYAGATMDSIAALAGVTKVTIYARYSDKAALLRAVLEERMTAWSIEAAEGDWAQGDTLDARLRHYAIKLMEWSRAPAVRAFAGLIAEVRSGDAAVAEAINRRLREPMLTLVSQEIADWAVRDGRIVRAPRRVALMFFGMIWSVLDFAGADAPTCQREAADHADQVVAVLMAGRAYW